VEDGGPRGATEGVCVEQNAGGRDLPEVFCDASFERVVQAKDKSIRMRATKNFGCKRAGRSMGQSKGN